jgi:hypothetical protein
MPNGLNSFSAAIRSNDFLVTMSGTSPWGINIIQKKIHVPFKLAQVNNPNGTAYFIPQGNSWSGTPIEYNYLFTGDSNNNVEDHVSSNYTPIPFIITGYTISSINDLKTGFTFTINQTKYNDASVYASPLTLGNFGSETSFSGNVQLVGQQPEIGLWLRAADAVVLPSPAEPFGLVLVEAMSRGVPVVAAAAGGPVEILEDGSGLLFAPGDPRDLGFKLLQLLTQPCLRNKLSEAGHARWAAKFSVEKMCQAMLEVYEEAMGTQATP